MVHESWAGAANGDAPRGFEQQSVGALTFNVQGGNLRLATPASVVSGSVIWTSFRIPSMNGEITGEITFSHNANMQTDIIIGADRFGAPAYGNAPGGYSLQFDNTGTTALIIRELDASYTALANVAVAFDTNPWRFRFRWVGTLLAGKAWSAALPEPGDWTVTATATKFNADVYAHAAVAMTNNTAAVRTSDIGWLRYDDLADFED